MRPLHLAFIVLLSILLMSYSANPPQRSTGAPGEDTCARPGCHSTGSSNIGQVKINGLPEQVVIGQTYPLSIILSRNSPSIQKTGFQMTILSDDTQLSIGNFSNPQENTTVSKTAGRQYAEHQPAKNFISDQTIYQVDWTAPQMSSNDLAYLHLSTVLANGNGNRRGDNVLSISRSFSITSLNQLAIEADIKPPACKQDNNGQISLSVSGGTPPYAYTWSTGDTSSTVRALPVGKYDVSISDQSGLSIDTFFIIDESIDKEAPIFSPPDTFRISSCAPFSYTIPTAVDGCDGDIDPVLISGNGPGSSFPIGISREIYEASDQLGNTAEVIVTIINELDINVDIAAYDVPCHSDSYGRVEIDVMGTHELFSILINGDDTLSLEQLPPGEYTITVKDKTGCSVTQQVSINRPAPLIIDSIFAKNESTANASDGSLTPVVSGGTPPYTYQWRTENNDFSTKEILNGLSAGTYLLTVTDANGCTTEDAIGAIDVSTSVHEISSQSSIRVYPSVTHGPIVIQADNSLTVSKITATDLNGRNFIITDDLSSLPKGLYVLSVYLLSGDIYYTKIVNQ